MNPETNTIYCGDALDVMRSWPDSFVQCCVTSPPYWGLRDYGVAGQLGLEKTPEEYVAKMVEVFREVRRVLKDDGTLWLNIGDSYAKSGTSGLSLHTETSTTGKPNPYAPIKKEIPDGLKPKDLVGIPWMVAFALRADGWWLRSDIIWDKPNPMPESVPDRPTKSHEYLFLLTKSARYYYDAKAIQEPSVTNDIRRPYGSQGGWEMDGRPIEQRHGGEPRSHKGSQFHTGKTGEHQIGRSSKSPRVHGNLPGRDDGGANCNDPNQEYRNKRSVWRIATQPFPGAHFATFPEKLVEPCVLAGSREGDIVLDPFGGSGTTGAVSARLGRRWLMIELNPQYIDMAHRTRLRQLPLL